MKKELSVISENDLVGVWELEIAENIEITDILDEFRFCFRCSDNNECCWHQYSDAGAGTRGCLFQSERSSGPV